MKPLIALFTIMILCFNVFGQKSTHPNRYAGTPFVTDSSTTAFIPVHYNEHVLSSDKLAAWGDYYADFIVYNFAADSYKRLFRRDVYIERMPLQRTRQNSNVPDEHVLRLPATYGQKLLLLVKATDTNRNGRIDKADASVLHFCSNKGDSLNAITDASENVVEVFIYESSGFAMIEFQRDIDNDSSFEPDEREYYFRRLNLANLSIGKIIPSH